MKKILHIPRSIFWGIFILVLTGIPGDFLPAVPNFMSLFEPDKIVHLIIFGIFTFLLIHDFRSGRYGETAKTRSVFYSIAISVMMGAATELMQAFFIPGRLGSPFDFIADAVGSGLGYAGFYFFKPRKWS